MNYTNQLLKSLEKSKVYSSLKGNNLGADLADMHLISKSNEGFWVLLCVLDSISKHAYVFHLKDKKAITITSAFKLFF